MVHHHQQNVNLGSDSELSDRSLPPIPRLCPKGSYVHNGVLFFSKSEAALATLLEKYVPGFVTSPGENFQVPIGNGRHVDFKVGDVLIEFHPVRPLHEMRDRREYREWRRELRNLREEDRAEFRRETHDHLANRYAERRQRAIDESPEYRGSELIVATTPQEFLDQVIRRFGVYRGSNSQFRAEFSELIREVKEANRQTRYRHPRRKAA